MGDSSLTKFEALPIVKSKSTQSQNLSPRPEIAEISIPQKQINSRPGKFSSQNSSPQKTQQVVGIFPSNMQDMANIASSVTSDITEASDIREYEGIENFSNPNSRHLSKEARK